MNRKNRLKTRLHILLNFFAFFLREKSWHSNQTNGILSSIDRKSLRDSNKWTSVGPGSFHMKKKQCGPEPIISNLEMVFFFKKYSDLLREKVVISVTRCWEIVFCYTNCSDLLWEKNVPVIEKYFKKNNVGLSPLYLP